MTDELTVLLLALFWTPRNVLIVIGSWSLILMIGKILPVHWLKIYKMHVVPALHLALCIGAVWTPGLRPEVEHTVEGINSDEAGFRFALGVCLALFAYVLPIIIMWAIEKWAPEKAKSIRRLLS